MTYTLDLKKLIRDLRGPKGFAAVTEEVTKLKTEIDRLRDKVEPQVESKLKKAQSESLT